MSKASTVREDRYKMRKLTVLVAIVASILPMVIIPLMNVGSSNPQLKSYTYFFTSVLGLIGSVLMLWQFFLGTRVLIRYIFPDMVWSVKMHRLLGTYGSLFTWLHPLLSIYALGVSWTYVIIPSFANRYETYMSYGRIAFLLFVIIWVTSAVVRGRIKYRPWKYLHMSSYIILPLIFLHGVANGVQIKESAIILVYWYALIAIYIALVVVRIGYRFGYNKKEYSVVKVLKKDDVILLTLKPDIAMPDSTVVPRAGQYVYVQRNSVFSESHPFTVAYYDSSSHEITLAIKSNGSFTQRIQNLYDGEGLLLDGPYGVFTNELDRGTAENESLHVVMFAGGIGVVPYLQHINTATLSRHDIVLFDCNRSPKAAIFKDWLRSNLGKNYIEVYTRVKREEAYRKEINIETGYLNGSIIMKYLASSDLQNTLFYICGPQTFMNNVRLTLSELGVSKNNIRSEDFGF